MDKPLEGVRVLDLSQLTSGPFATMMLADQGADVIVVEPTTPCGFWLTPFQRGGFTPLVVNHTRGKRSIALDWATDEGRDVVLDLMAEADVVVQNYRPGVVERLGLGYDDAVAVNESVIYVSVSGFGPTGPYRDHAVVDPVIQALAGIVARQQSADIPLPDLVRNIMVDKATAMAVAQSVGVALFQRERTGSGAHVEVPMLDVGIYFFWPDAMADHTFLGDGVGPGWRIVDRYALTRCADGVIIQFPASEAQAFELWRQLGHPEWVDDPRFNSSQGRQEGDNIVVLGRAIAEAFASLHVDDILPRLQEAGIPAARVLEPEEVFDDPQVVHNGTLVEWDHPRAGRIRQPRPPIRWSTAETPLPRSAPGHGEHTDEILAAVGRTAEEIEALRRADVVV